MLREHGSLIEMIFLVLSHRRHPRAFGVALRCSMAIDPRFVGSSRAPAICKSSFLPYLKNSTNFFYFNFF
jgi:hypothetical protein